MESNAMHYSFQRKKSMKTRHVINLYFKKGSIIRQDAVMSQS